MANLKINGVEHRFDGDADMPLLWWLRENLGLTGTKFGCGEAQCGSCTVHVNGVPRRSCVTPVSAVDGAEVVTIEGLASPVADAVRASWRKFEVPQCGFCQSGQIMSAAALLAMTPDPTEDHIDAAMSGNICRCGTYQRIRRAIKDAAGAIGGSRDG